MHESVKAWGRACMEDVGPVATCLEVGSYDVNGSLRPFVDAATYTGIDVLEGPGVDKIMDGLDAPSLGLFDLVICTEVLEHAEHPAALLLAVKACVAPGGHILVSTRSPGYPWHGEVYRERDVRHWIKGPDNPTAPETSVGVRTERDYWHIGDHWRFTPADLTLAFLDFAYVDVQPDPDEDRPGVLAFARRSRWPAPLYRARPQLQP